MAAVNGATPVEDEFEHLVRSAQDRLRRAEELARLADDPATEAFSALAAHLDVLAGHHRLEKERVNARLDVLDGRLDEIHEIHGELQEVGAAATAAARAEIGKAQAEFAREATQQIAAAAAVQLKMVTRTSWLRAVSAAVSRRRRHVRDGRSAWLRLGQRLGRADDQERRRRCGFRRKRGRPRGRQGLEHADAL